MRVSSVAGKSERIKTHQCNFYIRTQKNIPCHSRAPWTRSGSQNEVIVIKFRHLVVNTTKHHTSARLPNNRIPILLVKIGYRLLGHLPRNAYMEHHSYACSKKQQTGFVDSPECRSDALILQAGYQ
ncbi:hypothetical protein M9H77_36429 [Catharanthus roseus]|uniref:Uncharacterized protein n=1 Tax=Catharanthus roseus TaxID=4058 RepID=A0ACB9ZST1_CATRO|nr:hypothetical protein M9H77_36429 [Catharanthus roseus]